MFGFKNFLTGICYGCEKFLQVESRTEGKTYIQEFLKFFVFFL